MRRMYFVSSTIVMLAVLVSNPLEAQESAIPSLDGNWLYRSLRNISQEGVDWNRLRLAEAPMTIAVRRGRLTGTLFVGSDFEMRLKGHVHFGNPVTLRFQGRGVGSRSRKWVYDYRGYLVPEWPAGSGQTEAIVGSVIRTEPHGQAQAGEVASFVIVRRSGSSDPRESIAGRRRFGHQTDEHSQVITGVPLSILPSPSGGSEVLMRRAMPEEDSAARSFAERVAPKTASAIPDSKIPNELERLLPKSRQLGRTLRSDTELRNPNEAMLGGDGYIQLSVDYSDGQIGDDLVRLRTYNGALVGPTIRVKAGEVLKVRLNNNLDDTGEPGHDPDHPNGHHDWNVTNLHTHGLHVAPQKLPGETDASDNVLLRIQPQDSQLYSIHVPEDHEAGTFWYHAHVHGATSAQVSSGMAGLLIIEKDESSLDQVPQIAAAKERLLVLQQIPFIKRDASGDIVEQGGVGQIELQDLAEGIFGPNYWHDSGRYTTVNGQETPRITIRPGEVQRWRMVHAGVREELRLTLMRAPGSDGPATLTMHEIAVDGLPLGEIRDDSQITLFPGYRSDVLVQAPLSEGHYVLVDDTSPGLTGGEDEPLKYIAHVVVEGATEEMELPDDDALASFRRSSITDDQVTSEGRQLLYGIRTEGGLKFAIKQDDEDWRPFSSDPADDLILQLNDVEELVIGTQNSGSIGASHPFHIHVNPFEVVEEWIEMPGGGRQQVPIRQTWRDTLVMEHRHRYRIRTHIEKFVGTFVHHCHILDHEDQGMMQRVTIVGQDDRIGSGDGGRRSGGASTSESRRDLVTIWKSGQPKVFLFVVGTSCDHCREQIQTFADSFDLSSLDLVVVSQEPRDASQTIPSKAVFFRDSEQMIFRSLGLAAGSKSHGIALYSGQNELIWKQAGNVPFVDVGAVRQRLERGNGEREMRGLPSRRDGTRERRVLIRKNIENLEFQELEAYKHALKTLFDSTDEFNNYDYFAELHNVFSVSPPHGCEHRNELFLPWHRYHLYCLERALQESDPDHPTLSTRNVTIPYWNWSSDHSGDRYPLAFEDNRSILFNAFRNRTPSGPPFSPDYLDDLIRDNPNWNDYAGGPLSNPSYGALESPSHNVLHSEYLGDPMWDPETAAEDPIFWSFHAFIDLQWARWQAAHGADPSCLDCALQGFSIREGRLPPTVRSTIDIREMGYEYDDDRPPVEIVPDETRIAAANARPLRKILAPKTEMASRTVALWGGAGPFQFNFEVPKEGFRSAILALTEQKVPDKLSYQIEFFAHPQDLRLQPDSKEFSRTYRLGSVALWKDHAGHHPQPVSARESVTSRLREVAKEHSGEQWTLSLVVRHSKPQRGAEAERVSADTLAQQVRFGDVVLLLNGARLAVDSSDTE